jgi:hypothetical protein
VRTLLAVLLSVSLAAVPWVRAEDEAPQPPPAEESAPAPPADDEAPDAPRATPPRLSYIYGEVSFWRPGAEDWAPARVNTPLAAGDSLYAGQGANLELQIGPRAFVRAGAGTDLAIADLEPDFLQLKVTNGHVGLDARALDKGQTIEVATPNAAFRIDRSGYYRIDIDEQGATFITRRGGDATVVPAGGDALAMGSNEQVSIEGTDSPKIERYKAPALDPWDQWNYQRTERLLEPRSAKYVPEDVYGAPDLDRYGSWRTEPQYGSVWVPAGVASDWAPYSTGRWIWDPYYGWTWIDDAPWGWAPYHYGRWVHYGGVWGWAPGPILVRPVYAPALVGFYGGSGVTVGIGIGAPFVSWVALGWGEPCIPWWGPRAFYGRPWWGGWGGPHVVNNVVINRTTIVNVNQVRSFRNAGLPHAITGVRQDRFGQAFTRQDRVRLTPAASRSLQPLHGGPAVRPTATSLVPASGRAARPPERVQGRSVVATRAPRDPSHRLEAVGLNAPRAASAPAPRIVSAPAGGGRGSAPAQATRGGDRDLRPAPAVRANEAPQSPARERRPAVGMPARGSQSPAVGMPPRGNQDPAVGMPSSRGSERPATGTSSRGGERPPVPRGDAARPAVRAPEGGGAAPRGRASGGMQPAARAPGGGQPRSQGFGGARQAPAQPAGRPDGGFGQGSPSRHAPAQHAPAQHAPAQHAPAQHAPAQQMGPSSFAPHMPFGRAAAPSHERPAQMQGHGGRSSHAARLTMR